MDFSQQIEEAIRRGKKVYAPQKGFQTNFLTSIADIVFGGGAAGAGKTSALLLAVARYHQVKNYGSVVFRRSMPEILQEGGLWDESGILYPMIGGVSNSSRYIWKFPDYGSKIAFTHLSNENDLKRFQGSQIPVIGFDELTHFTKKMFIYLISRNRSARCGIDPRIYAVMNPDPDSWVAEFIEWFIDQESGYPIKERAGVLRYFIGEQDNIIQGSTKQEVIDKVQYIFEDPLFQGKKPEDFIKSFTFIPGTIDDNQELLRNNPQYLANLKAQDEETQLRLLRGNWKIKSDKMNLFTYIRLSDMFSNIIDQKRDDKSYIIIDHARMGRDLCVIGSWIGWRCVQINILPTSDTNDILRVVADLRRRYHVPVSQVLIDQDGIGVKDSLQCRVFQGNGSARDEKINGKIVKTNYRNRRVQNYFLLADKINKNEISVDLNNVWLHTNQIDSRLVRVLKIGGKTQEVKDMIRDDLRIIRRENPDSEGKIVITSKAAIQNAINRSPDIGDMLMMRCEYEFVKDLKYLS